MADFTFLKNSLTGKSVILAPRRAKRPNDESHKHLMHCPFCVGNEGKEEELYRVPLRGDSNDHSVGWRIRVIKNKFPFVPYHEVIILSPDHDKGIDELSFSQVECVLKTYRERFNANSKNGQPYIFHNGGKGSGESLSHPHSQLAVIPFRVTLDIPVLAPSMYFPFSKFHFPFVSKRFVHTSEGTSNDQIHQEKLQTDNFIIFCPVFSEWPDEVWVVPQNGGKVFGEITDNEITDLGYIIARLLQIFSERYNHDFPFNFYIYPGKNWYFRLIPRRKVLGGFEIGTGIMVNTQDPIETFRFIKEHFWNVDPEKIRREHLADYAKRV